MNGIQKTIFSIFISIGYELLETRTWLFLLDILLSSWNYSSWNDVVDGEWGGGEEEDEENFDGEWGGGGRNEERVVRCCRSSCPWIQVPCLGRGFGRKYVLNRLVPHLGINTLIAVALASSRACHDHGSHEAKTLLLILLLVLLLLLLLLLLLAQLCLALWFQPTDICHHYCSAKAIGK